MESQEWEDGKTMMNEAREKALKLGRWTHKLKAEAVFGVGMMTDAECGVTDILQEFIMHRETDNCEGPGRNISQMSLKHNSQIITRI